jgi:hypothetical protein
MLGVRRRYWRFRRRFRSAKLTGGIWKPLAIAEAVVILAVVGFGGGLLLRAAVAGMSTPVNRVAPLAETGGRHASVTPAASPVRALPASPKGSPSPQLSALVQLAAASATARTGLAYVDAGCAAGGKCFSSARETDGQDAAYVELAAQGYGGATICYVYLDNPSAGWQAVSMACGAAAGFAPAQDATVLVRAPGTCGRLRRQAGAQSAVVRCLANGTPVAVTGAPVLAGGQLWWPVSSGSAAGMMVQDLLVDPSAIVA